MLSCCKSHYNNNKNNDCVNKEARLVILLKMTVNKVVQMKYNFDASDPQTAPNGTFEHPNFNKNSEGEFPQTPLKVRALWALGRVPSPP